MPEHMKGHLPWFQDRLEVWVLVSCVQVNSKSGADKGTGPTLTQLALVCIAATEKQMLFSYVGSMF